ncbi:uncharacterized protein PRCAT00000573001 [Priceomyces carsonii]|uniref:uncharacterized protein n=1 Tax=Priceomyces carsonii TaxID=28549 RepID=UPI002EDAEA31|nr:unnamed protein product [Priceomyces carsonii]
MSKRKANAEPGKVTKKPVKQIPKFQCSLCIPSTIISESNARNLDQATSVAYQVAKAATLFNVSEIVILSIPEDKIESNKESVLNAITIPNDQGGKKLVFNFADDNAAGKIKENTTAEGKSPNNEKTDEKSLILAALLHYFVTPPYLVKSVFASSKCDKKFKYASKLPKLSSLPFMSNNNVFKDFKEGLTIPKHTPKIKKNNKKVSPLKKLAVTKYVNIGEPKPMELKEQQVPVNVRVTVDLKNKKIVSPVEAYGVIGAKSSFGYHVRICKSFSDIFRESSFPDGYSSSVYVNCNNFFDSNEKPDETEGLTSFERANITDRANVLLVLGNPNDYSLSFSRDASNLEGVQSFAQMMDSKMLIPEGARIEDGVTISLTKLYS